jgi:hypothetical protein
VNGQPQIQIRFMTTNAAGNDEWVGVDNIGVTSEPIVGATVSVANVSVVEDNPATR